MRFELCRQLYFMAKPVQVWTLKSTYRQSTPDFSTTFPELPIVINDDIFLLKNSDAKVESIKVITLFLKEVTQKCIQFQMTRCTLAMQ